ncbi:MAG: signal peptidase, partial [Gemmatimonadaceae bacterium]|nr:signal peptidase [Gemmatimonadaceae bacterium]
MPQRANKFWTIFLTVVLLDVVTKRFAVRELTPYIPRDIIGDFFRFTLAFNPGGAMSLSLGPSSRWWFTLLSIATLFILGYMYKQTSADDRLQIGSLALICGGAVGNLLDRVRSPRG